MSFLISDAWAQAPAAAAGAEGGLMGLLFPIGLILILAGLAVSQLGSRSVGAARTRRR